MVLKGFTRLALLALVLGSSLAPAALASGARALDDDAGAGDEIKFDTIAVDDFSSYPNVTYVSAANVRGGYLLDNVSPELVDMPDASGGTALVISNRDGGNATNEWKRIISKAFFPFGPEESYEVEVRMKRSPDFSGQVLAGASAFASDNGAGDPVDLSQDFFALEGNSQLSTDFKTYATVAAGGQEGGSLLPLVLINFGGSTDGEVYLDSLTIRKAESSEEAFRLKESAELSAPAAAQVATSGARSITFATSFIGAALLSLACL